MIELPPITIRRLETVSQSKCLNQPEAQAPGALAYSSTANFGSGTGNKTSVAGESKRHCIGAEPILVHCVKHSSQGMSCAKRVPSRHRQGRQPEMAAVASTIGMISMRTELVTTSPFPEDSRFCFSRECVENAR